MTHPNPEVKRAIVQLCDALCTCERATGNESVLIIREAGGFEFRAAGGKPIASDVTDEQLFGMIGWKLKY